MDIIILLIVFGVISSISKNSKKNQAQNRKPGGQMPPRQNLPTPPSTVSQPQRPATPQRSQESLQGTLTSLFNALAGEEVLKSPEEKKREEYQRRLLEEAREKEALQAKEKELAMQRAAAYAQEEEEDILEAVTLSPYEEGTSSNESPVLNLADAKQGIIWKEILDRPKALR
ncbi:MAG TPA: hypothetical protein DEA52_02030 [Clostridiaceae bacterium]|nr:hypothetical protein [Clostridiaceae bacterium]